MQVLIVKTSSMGDVVHTLPTVSDMAQAIPNIQVDWLVEKAFAAIPAQHHAVHRVIPLQWRQWRKSLCSSETWAALRAWRHDMAGAPYDVIIDMQGLLKSAAFACFAKGVRAGYDWHSIKEPFASLSYQRKAHVPRQLHAVDRCRQLAAKVLGYTLPGTPPDFGLRPQAQAWTPASGEPFAVLIPCASRPEKHWSLADWITVGQDLKTRGWQVGIMWGSPEEHRLAQDIARDVKGAVPPFLTVQQASDTLAQARLVVGLDTGMSHIAAAHGRPTVGIYCDHEPGLAGLRGSGPVMSLGGKGQRPTLDEVRAAIQGVLAAEAP